MAYVKNLDPNGERMLPDQGVVINPGEWAEVDDDVAENLARQSVWELVREDGSPIKAANERAESRAEDEAEQAAIENVPSTEPGAETTLPSPSKGRKRKNTRNEEAN